MAQPFDLTHQECPRNTLGASRKYARDMVTVVRHGKWVVDEILNRPGESGDSLI